MHHILPVASVFIIDKMGKIAYVHTNPDWKMRMSADDIVDAAKNIGMR